MAIFHVMGKPNLTILDFDSRGVQVTKNVLCAMFAIKWRSLHVSKDVSYKDNNIVLSYVYQVLDVNPRRMFWTITNGRYQITGENVFNNSQDNVVTLGTSASMANIVVRSVVMKEKPNVIFHDSKFFVPIVESLFIDLCDSSNEDDLSPLDVVVPISMNSWADEKQALRTEVLFVNSWSNKEQPLWMEVPFINSRAYKVQPLQMEVP